MKEEWRITSKWITKMDEVIHEHVNSGLCHRYPDLQIVNEHEFYLAPDSGGDLNSIRIFIGVTNKDMDEHDIDLELFGGAGIVALPAAIYDEMYHNSAVMSNFELAMGDVLDKVTNQSHYWSGVCGIVHELKTYISLFSKGGVSNA